MELKTGADFAQMQKSELINRQTAIEALRNTKFRNDLFLDFGYENAINIIESLPSVQYFFTCDGCRYKGYFKHDTCRRCIRNMRDLYEPE